MPESITATDLQKRTVEAFYDRIPDECPICHREISPIYGGRAFISGIVNETHWRGDLEILYRCPKQDCARAFIAIYRQHVQNTGDRNWFFLERLAPSEFEPPLVEDAVREISPNFVEIYGQALAAERSGLNQVSGCGLRRAVEFLIKDYLIQKRPQDSDAIEKAFLGTCINNYVTDTNIKTCASRATWLGNDQTHYKRKYEDRDISHLKKLIQLTLYWMGSEILTDKYTSELSKK